MNRLKADHSRLRAIATRLSRVAADIEDTSGSTSGAVSDGSATAFPSMPEGQSIARGWDETRALAARIMRLIGEGTHGQAAGVQETNTAYASTDVDNGADIDHVAVDRRRR